MRNNIYKSNFDDFNKFSSSILKNTILELLDSGTHIISIALSGGNTPIPILNILKSENIDWNRICFYMVDERCVPIDSSDCNYNNINKVFFKEIPSKSFSMLEEGISYKKSSENYQLLLENNLNKSPLGVPIFDLILLGMGEDGHTASLFPNTKALNEKFKYVVLNEVPQLSTQRITLSYPVLLEAENIFVLFKGQKKENIVKEIYANKGEAYPITKVAKEHSNIKWIIG